MQRNDKQLLVNLNDVRILCIATLILSVVVLIGWANDDEALKSVLPGLVSMKVNTALGFIFSSIGMLLLTYRQSEGISVRRISQLAIVISILIGLLSLLEVIFNIDFGIDQAIFIEPHNAVFTSHPGRMSVLTMLNFIFLGGILLLITRGRFLRAIHVLAGLIIMLSILPIFGYLFGDLSFPRIGSTSAMAAHTAIGFLVMATAVLRATQNRGYLEQIQSRLGDSLRTINFVLGLSLFLIVIASVIFNFQERRKAISWVEQTYQTMLELEQVSSNLHGYGEMIRAYLVTGDALRIDQAHSFHSKLLESLTKVRALTSDNPEQLTRLDVVQPKIVRRMEIVDRFIKRYHFQQQKISKVVQEIDEVDRLVVIIDRDIDDIQRVEKTRLSERRRYSSVVDNTFVVASATTGILGLFFIILVYRSWRNAELALKKQADLLELAHDSIIVRDLDSKVVYWNRGAVERYGWTKDQAVGSVTHELLQTKFPSLYDEIKIELFQKGRWEGELIHTIKDGSKIIVSSRWQIQFDNGKPVAILEINNDITERKQAEISLKLHRDHLEQMVNERTAQLHEAQRIAHLGSWHWDIDTGNLIWSDEVFRIFGYEPGAFTATFERFTAVVHPEDIDKLNKALEGALHHQQSYSLDLRIILPNKDQRWIHAEGLANLNAAGRAISMSGTVQNIDSRKEIEGQFLKAKEEAERANSAKSEFLSRMSHELRTPLNAILGFGQLLESDAVHPLNQSQLENVHEILYGGRHLLELVNEVLDLSRIESGRLDLIMEAVEIEQFINYCIAQIKPLANQRDISFSINMQKSCKVLVDKSRLKQVLLNLLSNAVKYNSESGSILISSVQSGTGYLRVSIQDTGKGIPVEFLSHLFQPFERMETAYEGIEGTGIGLALVKKLVEAMQGKVGVNSEVGKGSNFWIELPMTELEPDSDITNNHIKTPLIGSPKSRHTLLYVEDNPANLRLVKKIISNMEDIDLLDAIDGHSGLAIAIQSCPDLILLDINLPGMDGMEVLQHLKNNPLTREIPVIAVSANAMQEDINRALAAGFKDYLVKPLDISNFFAVINAILHR